MTSYGHDMTLHGLTFADGPLGEAEGSAQFTTDPTVYAEIEGITGSELVPQKSFTISMQVFKYQKQLQCLLCLRN